MVFNKEFVAGLRAILGMETFHSSLDVIYLPGQHVRIRLTITGDILLT